MKVLIIEDEIPAYKRLSQLLQGLLPAMELSPQIDSISGAVHYLKSQPQPDLIFLDIQLADGLSFSIFEQFEVSSPIIFTTAFDQYALKAFKVHSVDYLLKPIEAEALQQALDKYQRFFASEAPPKPNFKLEELIKEIQKPTYRARFMVKSGSSLSYLNVTNIAYLYSDQSLVFARLPSGKQYHLDTTLDQLHQELDPTHFFRVSRKMLLHISSIQKIDTYFNGRLLLHLLPEPSFQTTVSRDRVNDFKNWLDR